MVRSVRRRRHLLDAAHSRSTRWSYALRIERLRNPQSFSQARPSFCQHILQAPSVERRDAHEYVVRTPFIYIESQLDQQYLYGCVAWHHLVPAAGGLSIRLKKVELLNCDAALPSMELFP